MSSTKESNPSQQSFYTALQEHQIRLLKIRPGHQASPIVCEIRPFQVYDGLDYIALSYTWVSPVQASDQNDTTQRQREVIEVVGDFDGPHRISITKNLHEFLLQARSDDSKNKNYFWVDAICINQGDEQERADQVKLMPSVYLLAKCVYAWLGQEDQHTKRSFELIRKLASMSGDEHVGEKSVKSLEHITPNLLNATGPESFSEIYADHDHWYSLTKLFQRNYFIRTWIIQEVTLGQRVVAICGSHEIDWKHITMVSKFVATTPWSRWITETQLTESQSPGIQSHHQRPNLIDADRAAGTTKESMLYSLIRFRVFQAQNPRDKIYALLGIVKDSTEGKDCFNPSYSKSVVEVYTQVAIQLLKESNELLLLAHAEGESFRTYSSLPSWVPDWSCTDKVGLGVTGYKRYCAAKEVPKSVEIYEYDKTLVVRGMLLDKIRLKGETKTDIGKRNLRCPGWISICKAVHDIYPYTNQPRLEVLWRALITDTGGRKPEHPAPEGYGPAFVSWITSEPNAGVNPGTTLAAPWVAEVSQLIPPTGLNNEASDHSTSPVKLGSEEYELVFSHALHLRPFLTDSGYLGVGSESLYENDSVWIIPGSRVPLILRKVKSGSFQVVGGAYVHGVMMGEALKSDSHFEEITIM